MGPTVGSAAGNRGYGQEAGSLFSSRRRGAPWSPKLWAPGATAVFHSWAGLDLDGAPRVRHSEQVTVRSTARCASLLGRFLPAGTLCTVPAPGAPAVAEADQCFGDAGGALVAGGKLIAVSATGTTGCVRDGVRLHPYRLLRIS